VPAGRGRKKMIAEKENHLLYNKNLQPFANKNRKQMTKAEACLWKYALRAKQMGYTFNRQRPVLNYIADFMCKELKLIIEVDGYSHLLEDVIENDIVRQQKLENAGFKVIRFKSEEVLKDIKRVREIIQITIDELIK
jgi:very-short-patch-repair endonuclease